MIQLVIQYHAIHKVEVNNRGEFSNCTSQREEISQFQNPELFPSSLYAIFALLDAMSFRPV